MKLLMILMLAAFTSCGIRSDPRVAPESTCICPAEKGSPRICREFALLIARAYVYTNLDRKFVDEKVVEKESSWLLKYHYERERNWGRGILDISIEIDKDSGEILHHSVVPIDRKSSDKGSWVQGDFDVESAK